MNWRPCRSRRRHEETSCAAVAVRAGKAPIASGRRIGDPQSTYAESGATVGNTVSGPLAPLGIALQHSGGVRAQHGVAPRDRERRWSAIRRNVGCREAWRRNERQDAAGMRPAGLPVPVGHRQRPAAVGKRRLLTPNRRSRPSAFRRPILAWLLWHRPAPLASDTPPSSPLMTADRRARVAAFRLRALTAWRPDAWSTLST
jgi:hypothetical protein